MKKFARFIDDRQLMVTKEEIFTAHRKVWRPGGKLPKGFSPKFFITTGHSLFPIIEVCGSWKLATEVLGDRLKHALEGETSAWIPIVVGPPEEEGKMLESIMTHGGWISSELCCKPSYTAAIGKVREFIETQIKPILRRSTCVGYREKAKLIRDTEASMRTILVAHGQSCQN